MIKTQIDVELEEVQGDAEQKIPLDMEKEDDNSQQTPSSIKSDLKRRDISVTCVDENDEEQGPVESSEEFQKTLTGWRWWSFIFAILSSTFLFALDNTIVANIQPVIVLEFNSISKISWMSSSLLIVAASTNLIWGKVFAQFEAKWTFIISVVMFEIGSALCGAAQNMNTIIIGRAICGLGGAGLYIGVMTLIAANTTIKERPVYIGGTGLTWGIGTVVGPIIGGAFTVSSASWRWSFYINLVVGAICAPIYVFIIPPWDPRPGVPFMVRAREMDYLGLLLTVGAFVSGVMAISFGGIQYAWSSPEIISMFVCSGVLFILLGVQQVKTICTNKVHRIFPVEFVKSRTMLCLFACTASGGASAFIPIYMIPIFFQFTRSDTAFESGIRLLPFIIVLILAIFINGSILSVHGLYMPWFMFGAIFSIIGASLMYTVEHSTSATTVYGYSILIGWGIGLFVQSGFSIAQALVKSKDVPLVIGFITCGQLSGISIALSAANCIFLNRSKNSLAALLPGTTQNQIESAIAGAGSSFVKSLDSALRDKVLEAIVRANSDTYALLIAGGAIVLLLSLVMKREKLFLTPTL